MKLLGSFPPAKALAYLGAAAEQSPNLLISFRCLCHFLRPSARRLLSLPSPHNHPTGGWGGGAPRVPFVTLTMGAAIPLLFSGVGESGLTSDPRTRSRFQFFAWSSWNDVIHRPWTPLLLPLSVNGGLIPIQSVWGSGDKPKRRCR